MKIEYMSDEDLMNMIDEIEAHDMVSAPPDLQSEVLARLGLAEEEADGEQKAGDLAQNSAPTSLTATRRKREYRNYCFKVIGASAAAILITFALPLLSAQKAPTPTKQEVLGASTATDSKVNNNVWGNIINEIVTSAGLTEEQTDEPTGGQTGEQPGGSDENVTDESGKSNEGFYRNLDRGILRKIGSSRNIGDYIYGIN